MLSLYAQDAWNPTARLGVTGGLRLDHYTDFGGTRAARAWPACTARAADLNFKLAYGRAVRAPSFLELFYCSPALPREPGPRPRAQRLPGRGGDLPAAATCG